MKIFSISTGFTSICVTILLIRGNRALWMIERWHGCSGHVNYKEYRQPRAIALNAITWEKDSCCEQSNLIIREMKDMDIIKVLRENSLVSPAAQDDAGWWWIFRICDIRRYRDRYTAPIRARRDNSVSKKTLLRSALERQLIRSVSSVIEINPVDVPLKYIYLLSIACVEWELMNSNRRNIVHS